MRIFLFTFLNVFAKITKRFYKYNLRVITYHEIPDRAIFKRHLNYLKSNYSIIDLDTLKEHIENGKILPKYPLLITFDDGYKNIFTNAIPELIDKKLPACIFIITSYVNSNLEFWWKSSLAYYDEISSKSKAAKKKNLLLKNIPNHERINLLNKIPNIPKEQITSTSFKQLEKHNISLCNHTHTHPILDKCCVKEICQEITLAQKCFDSWEISGKNIFAYPNGNWTVEIEKILNKKEIKLAFLFDHKINRKKINPLRISRLSTNATMSIPELSVKVAGLHSIISKIW
ncbi:polysaccharide deacetylase family protein [Christiangramia aquimixticola]|uniref:polysaccharide deacetylase family protein n=1 Tax=Christiangramia aquimixticola TaxID=1697558 RepID=UPI003AA896F5